MDSGFLIDLVLAAGVLILAWLSLVATNLFKAIVLFISLGLLVTVVWVRLGAVDVAIAEAAIGAGLTGALLLAAWRRLWSQRRPVRDASGGDDSGGDNVS